MKITKKRLIAGLGSAALAASLVAGVAACGPGGNNGNQQESHQQQTDTTNLEKSQPLPAVYRSQERQNLIDIELAEVNDVQTTSFFMHMGSPDPMGWCPSIGFGIPDSASLSNPLTPYQGSINTGADSPVVGQMDPNGIYAPTSSAGTFVICLTSSGQPYIDRIEDNVDTAGGPATWDYTKHIWDITGAPTAIATVVPASSSAHR